MKAAVIEQHETFHYFTIKNVPSPKCGKGQILIRNKASSVNPIDTLVRKGAAGTVAKFFGHQILGSDFCGTVIGSRSDYFNEGDEVYGFNSALSGGAYAEEVAVDEEHAAPKPVNLSHTEAGVLPLVTSTAWQGLFHDGEMKCSDHVIITGCTGGVGSMAVQLAKNFGHRVTGVCSEAHVEFARRLGCDEVICYESEDIPADHQFDLFFDAAGKYTLSDFQDSLKESGIFVSTRGGIEDIGSAAEALVDVITRPMKIMKVKPRMIDLLSIKKLVEESTLKPVIADVFPLEALDKAYEMVENEHFIGKIAVTI